jgi:hypothetical protein
LESGEHVRDESNQREHVRDESNQRAAEKLLGSRIHYFLVGATRRPDFQIFIGNVDSGSGASNFPHAFHNATSSNGSGIDSRSTVVCVSAFFFFWKTGLEKGAAKRERAA